MNQRHPPFWEAVPGEGCRRAAQDLIQDLPAKAHRVAQRGGGQTHLESVIDVGLVYPAGAPPRLSTQMSKSSASPAFAPRITPVGDPDYVRLELRGNPLGTASVNSRGIHPTYSKYSTECQPNPRQSQRRRNAWSVQFRSQCDRLQRLRLPSAVPRGKSASRDCLGLDGPLDLARVEDAKHAFLW